MTQKDLGLLNHQTQAKQENGEDVFVHTSGLIDQIRENDEVTYDVERGKKGMNAVNVELLK